jgi:hypothetical protein
VLSKKYSNSNPKGGEETFETKEWHMAPKIFALLRFVHEEKKKLGMLLKAWFS